MDTFSYCIHGYAKWRKLCIKERNGMPNTREEDLFQEIVDLAVENPTDVAPENPNELDVYCDSHYNVYMFIKNEWTSTGINVTALSGKL